jgi:mRNA-degrading endonuclease RelE of RelBE toxin-antitoxin system
MATGGEPKEPASRLPPYVKRPVGERNPPGARFSYPVHAKNRSVVSQWDALCSTYPGPARRCYDHLAQTPYDRPPNPARGHALRGSKRLGGRELIQYEVGGGARVWYKVDDERHIVVIQEVFPGHPKATERP